MNLSNLAQYVISVVAAGTIVAGCSGNGASLISTPPGGTFLTTRHLGFHGRQAPVSETRGIYATVFLTNGAHVVGFPKNGGKPICHVRTGDNAGEVGVDYHGNLIVPVAFSGIKIYRGPSMCGPLAHTIPDSVGQLGDAAAHDALTGTIVVGHVNGIVATCTVASNTCTRITAPNMTGDPTVAMDKSGNCYATAFDVNTFTPALWYWAGCTGTGTELGSAQGFTQSATGGLDIDDNGNLVVLEQGAPSSLTVYSGCGTGTCTLVTGPTPLSGVGSNDCVYGTLGRQNERYACGDGTLGQIDIYSYLPSRTPSYLYSFNVGLQSNIIEGAVYAPSSRGD